ncbi:MAG: hypothetical protein PHT40_01685 [Patescibacteria group bacterium]|nr:hypothetical protein [Patescibacteria group bacterium]
MKPATVEQMAELRKIIISSNQKYVSDFGKKAMLFVLENSENLTKGVKLVFISTVSKDREIEVGYTVHQMVSSGHPTPINEKMEDLGIKFSFDWGSYESYRCLSLCHRARIYPGVYKDEVEEAKQVEVKVFEVAPPIKEPEVKALVLFQEIEKISLEL